MDAKKRSQELFEELERLESTRDGIELRWREANDSPELHQLVIGLLVKERTGPPEKVDILRVKMGEKLKERDQERDEYGAKWESLCKEIEKYSIPEITEGLAKITYEISTLKIQEHILERSSGGQSMKSRLRLSTNRDGIIEAKKIAASATEKSNAMRHESVQKIKDFIEEQLQKIRAIDLTLKEVTVDEFEHERSGWISSPVR